MHALNSQAADAWVRASRYPDGSHACTDLPGVQVIIMGGSDYAYDGDNGQTWSQRLTNIGTCI